jgi:hypothetical protein
VLNLEAALRETDKRVLLVDCDQVSSLNLASSLAGLLERVEGKYDYILIARVEQVDPGLTLFVDVVRAMGLQPILDLHSVSRLPLTIGG